LKHNIKVRKLSSGVDMVLEYIPYVQSVSIGVWIRTGSVDEDKNSTGISHLIEHMIFKGTKKRSAKMIAEDVDKIGSQINAFTGKEATCFYIKSLSANVEDSVEIIMDIFLNSVFDKYELEKEKQVIIEEMKMIEDTPEEDIHDMICELVFKGIPLSQPVIGTKSSISGITRNRIKKYMEEEYTNDSVVISVAGNFNEEKILNMVEEKLTGLNEVKEERAYHDFLYKPGGRVKVKSIEQAHICLGLPGVKLDDEKYYDFAVLNTIVGGTMSARLFQSIREEKGLAYSVYSTGSSFTNAGIFSIYAAVSHDRVWEALDAIKDELFSLKNDGVTADELKSAKEQLKGSYIFSQENVNGRMFSNGKNMTLLGKIFMPEEVILGIDKVSSDDIAEVSSIIKNIENYSAALITDRKTDIKKWIKSH